MFRNKKVYKCIIHKKEKKNSVKTHCSLAFNNIHKKYRDAYNKMS